ncbi:MAG: sodium:alanine symporter family protein [Nitrospinaceae bacterium]|nr:MAG: sodium:alanine symporter family protein [Nitrospinaceae bacterium]
MQTLNAGLAAVSGFMWGPWLLALLLGTGVLLTFRLRGVQFRQLGYALRLAFGRAERYGDGDISHLGALMTALASTVGVGNIAGVATAVAMGGPGAVFWMWITALFGMATKYAEGLLAVRHRRINGHGRISGGPMFYLEDGLGQKWLGMCFALAGALAAFGIGNMVQANTTAAALNEVLPIGAIPVGLMLAFLTAMVILGGIERIAQVAILLVPFMVLVYLLGALVVILSNLSHLGEGLLMILNDAFTGTAATGGFLGASVAQTMRFGIARGLFSNESGLGSAPIAAAAAKTDQPAKQALVSMTGTFLDTIVVCSITGLAIAASQAWTSGETGVALTMNAFASGLPGQWGHWIITLAVAPFAFSTILGWCYYGEKCFEYLTGLDYIDYYRYAWVAAVFIGAVVKLDLVWNFSDIMNALMAIPNLIGLICLNGRLVQEIERFEVGVREGLIEKYS